jgi:RNA polymerase sigma-70 factor (ECF subfamily)
VGLRVAIGHRRGITPACALGVALANQVGTVSYAILRPGRCCRTRSGLTPARGAITCGRALPDAISFSTRSARRSHSSKRLPFEKVRLKETLESVMPATSQAQKWPADYEKTAVASLPPAPVLEFREIYDHWFGPVSRWVRAMGSPQAESEDLVQDVFVVVHRRLPDFDGNNLPGWLYQIARRRVRDFRRLAWVKRTLFGGEPLLERLSKGGPSAFDAVETNEKRALLEQLLTSLNESERAALMLFETDNYTCEQVAELQGVPVSTVWARIHKARKKLKAQLAKREDRQQKRGR